MSFPFFRFPKVVVRLRLAFFSMALILVTGCLSAPQPKLGAVADAAPSVVTIKFELRNAVGPTFDGEPNGGPVSVPANATVLLGEARWTCDYSQCTLTLAARAPDGTAVATKDGANSATVSVPTPMSGNWNLAVFPKDPAVVHASGEIRVSVFTTAPPPGYSAFASSHVAPSAIASSASPSSEYESHADRLAPSLR